jgi:hypothetical protein
VAHPRSHDLDQHFAGLGALEIELDDFERLLGRESNGGAGFHVGRLQRLWFAPSLPPRSPLGKHPGAG